MTYDIQSPAHAPDALNSPPVLAPAPQPVPVTERPPTFPLLAAPEAPAPATISAALDNPAPRTSRRKSADSGRQRALALRTARKAIELSNADALTLNLLSAILSTSTDAADLTCAAIAGGAKSFQPATDALEILDANPLEAGIHAAALGRARLRQTWRVFAALDVIAGEAPASDAKAAIALVRAIHEGETADIRDEIEAALTLVKR